MHKQSVYSNLSELFEHVIAHTSAVIARQAWPAILQIGPAVYPTRAKYLRVPAAPTELPYTSLMDTCYLLEETSLTSGCSSER